MLPCLAQVRQYCMPATSPHLASPKSSNRHNRNSSRPLGCAVIQPTGTERCTSTFLRKPSFSMWQGDRGQFNVPTSVALSSCGWILKGHPPHVDPGRSNPNTNLYLNTLLLLWKGDPHPNTLVTVSYTHLKISFGRESSKKFTITSGVKQGDELSATLFKFCLLYTSRCV